MGRYALGVLVALCPLNPVFAQELATACVMYGPTYHLSSDVVDWSMTLASGQSCLRGLRANLTTLDEIKIVTAPLNGQLTVEGPAFIYRGDPSFTGVDRFSFLVTGKINRVRGSSTINVVVSVK